MTVPSLSLTWKRRRPSWPRHVRDRFDATGLCLGATLRSDGWPRISPVEPLILEGRLYLGMIPNSTKSRDLARDPRCLVHSTVTDKTGTEGEVKLYGNARRIRDEDEIERYCVALEATIGWRQEGPRDLDLWVLDLSSGAYRQFRWQRAALRRVGTRSRATVGDATDSSLSTR
jgi:hypothetical protein